jgi:thymus-specific serine protease
MVFEMARENNGALFYTEHRYYGKSQPTENTSTKNLEFLTVEQALEDLRHFIEFIKSSNEYKNSGVILVGASYAGTLATWARRQYPNLVNGAWSSSGPLLVKVDFNEYNEEMSKSIRLVGGENCLRKLENAFQTIEDYAAFSEPKVLAKIKNDFNLCEPLKLCRDIAHFFYELRDAVASVVQKHRSGDIQKVCQFMMDPKYSDDVAAFGAWINSGNRKKCLDMNYEHAVKYYTNTTWGSPANRQLRQWTYQVNFSSFSHEKFKNFSLTDLRQIRMVPDINIHRSKARFKASPGRIFCENVRRLV